MTMQVNVVLTIKLLVLVELMAGIIFLKIVKRLYSFGQITLMPAKIIMI